MNKRPCIELTVKFSDCDPFGHLYNVRYLDYLFNGREQHVIDNYPLLRSEMLGGKCNWVISSTDIRYLQSVKWGEKVTVESSILQAGRNSLTLEIVMLNAESAQLKAILWSKLYHIELKRGIVTNHREEIQEFLNSIRIHAGVENLDERIQNLSRQSREAPAQIRTKLNN